MCHLQLMDSTKSLLLYLFSVFNAHKCHYFISITHFSYMVSGRKRKLPLMPVCLTEIFELAQEPWINLPPPPDAGVRVR